MYYTDLQMLECDKSDNDLQQEISASVVLKDKLPRPLKKSHDATFMRALPLLTPVTACHAGDMFSYLLLPHSYHHSHA